ncbi:MAG: MFS transporter [Dehalococcoidia bacterium]
MKNGPIRSRVLLFASGMHAWNDLFFALLVPLLPVIKEDLGLSFAEIGLLRSVFSGASAILQIPVGYLAESVGEFWLLVLGNVWVSLGLIGMGLSSTFPLLLAVSFLGGLGGGAQHPLGSSMVARAYDGGGRSTAVGTVNFAGDLGKMIAPLGALLAIPFGWRAAVWSVGLAGLVFMTASVPLRRAVDIGRPQPRSRDSVAEGTGHTRMGGFVLLSLVGFLDSGTRGASLVFLPFIMDAKNLGTGEISVLLVLLFAGGAAGKYLVGWLGDRFSPVALIWGTKGLTAALLVLSLAVSPLALVPLMILLGVGLNGTSSALYASVAELVPAHRRARLYGYFYTTNEFGTVLAPLVYGLIADLFSLNITVIVMGAATLVILPVSLTLRRHLDPRNPAPQSA